jgi:hypothetical protein
MRIVPERERKQLKIEETKKLFEIGFQLGVTMMVDLVTDPEDKANEIIEIRGYAEKVFDEATENLLKERYG